MTTVSNQSIEIVPVQALTDNLCYLIHRKGSEQAIVIDPSEAQPISTALDERGWTLGLILNTHHHHDHVGGNLELAERYGAPIWCSSVDEKRVPGAQRGFTPNESFEWDGIQIKTLSIPGHTRGQVAYHVSAASALFVGDTVFAMGCGRLFEGTAEEMWRSLALIQSLPPHTRLYFGHEYTERNAAFNESIEPSRNAVRERLERTRVALREVGFAPAPTIEEERQTNVFLRASESDVKLALGLADHSDLEVFAQLRRMRDVF